MPEAKILVRGKMPGLSVKMQAILGDAWLRAQRVGEYAVWRKPLTFYNPARGSPGQSRGDPQPGSVQLVFAVAASGSFYFGAEGPIPEVLTVAGTFFWDGPVDGNWDSSVAPTGYCRSGGEKAVDDGVYRPGILRWWGSVGLS